MVGVGRRKVERAFQSSSSNQSSKKSSHLQPLLTAVQDS